MSYRDSACVERQPRGLNMALRIGIVGTGRMAQWLGVERWHERYQDLLACPDIDAVVIATPSSTHAEIVCDAARAGNPIFCEKPLALTIAETDRAIAAAAAAGVPLQVGFHSTCRS